MSALLSREISRYQLRIERRLCLDGLRPGVFGSCTRKIGTIFRGGGWTWRNAYTIEERHMAIEMSGAVFYANPEDCEPVRELMAGFGEHERESRDKYFYDNPKDMFREL